MIRSQNEATAIMILDGEVTNGETASGYVDTLDYDYCTIDVLATISDNTTNNFTTLDLSEGLVSNAYTAIAAFTGTADAGFTVPVADTSNPQVVSRFNVDCSKYERYLRMEVAVLTTQAIAVVARLGYTDETPTTVAALGQAVVVTA